MINSIAIIDESEEECLIAEPISGVFKKGEKKALLKNLENILADRDGLPRWGICDVFSPPRSSKEAANFGLRDDGAFDIKTGWNFHLLADRRRLWKHLEDIDPLLTVTSPPCRFQTALQNVTPMHKRRDPEAYLQNLEDSDNMVDFSMRMSWHRRRVGRYSIFEAPTRARTWSLESVVKWLKHPEVHRVTVNACAVGVTDPVTKMYKS